MTSIGRLWALIVLVGLAFWTGLLAFIDWYFFKWGG